VFLTAADLPLGEAALAAALVSRIGEADACVIRRSNGEPEPLFAVYRRSCLQPVERCLVEGQRSCRALLEQIEVNWVREADLPEWDLDRVLWNVNTPEAYRQALRMLNNDSFS
jgi:molybdopterin-guanine dinucleotide biosynthesis protein A